MRNKLYKISTAAIVLTLTFTLSCSGGGSDGGGDGGNNGGGGGNFEYGSLPYQGQIYKTIKIGSQTWMAENLNYDVPSNDTDVCYDNNTANCAKYGRLYNWATAMDLPASCNTSSCASQITANHRGICPTSWHIPSDAEWQTLVDFAGGENVAGTKLKARSGWRNDKNGKPGNGTDDFGFAALPGGNYDGENDFYRLDAIVVWWSATEINADKAYDRYMRYDYEGVGRNTDTDKDYYWQNVRCLKD